MKINVKLKQIVTINAGYPFRGKILEVANAQAIVVQMKDVSPAIGIRWSGCVNTGLTGKRHPGWLQTGDILIAARGSHNYAVEVVGAHLNAVAAPHFFIVRIKKKEILPGYLAWFLNQAPCQRYFKQNSEGSLTKSIRRSVLEEALIAIPSLIKQRAIINLDKTLKQEQYLLEQLRCNNEQLMKAIVNDLLIIN